MAEKSYPLDKDSNSGNDEPQDMPAKKAASGRGSLLVLVVTQVCLEKRCPRMWWLSDPCWSKPGGDYWSRSRMEAGEL